MNPSQAKCWLLRMHDSLTSVGFFGAVACAVGVICIFVYEVMARYFFSEPPSWADPMSSYALCGLIFLAMPEITRCNGHIAVTVVPDMLPQHAKSILRNVNAIMACTVCLLAAWFCLNATIDQFENGIQTEGVWTVQKWLISVTIPYGMLSSGLYFLRQFLHLPTWKEDHSDSSGGVMI